MILRNVIILRSDVYVTGSLRHRATMSYTVSILSTRETLTDLRTASAYYHNEHGANTQTNRHYNVVDSVVYPCSVDPSFSFEKYEKHEGS